MRLKTASQAKKTLARFSSPVRARHALRFFKTGPGEYGEGDRFIGVTVPCIRQVVVQATDLPLHEVKRLVSSPVHEERMLGFLICVRKVEHARKKTLKNEENAVVQFYLKHLKFLNNWDLIDVTVPKVLGPHFFYHSRKQLSRWIASKNLWERRVAILTTHEFIRQGEFDETLRLCKRVLGDKEDLIHKASGWMLREMGKRDVHSLRRFLNQNAAVMPRTMLRYAIEKLSPRERKKYMEKKTKS